MKKNTISTKMLFLSLVLGTIWNINAQSKVGQNVININSNAVFEMEHPSKGMLLPRLGLSSTTAFAPLTAHVAGMTVYNTATTGDVTPGYYYNDGTKWVRIFGTSAANNTTAANLITITNGTGATLTAMTVGVDTTALKSFLNNKITVTANAPLTGNGTSSSPLGVTQNNTTAANLITITNGTGATFTAMTVGVDTTALKSFLAGKVSIIANAPLSGAGTTASPLAITTGDLTAGTLLQTTGTPTGAALKTAGYQVDTAALKTFMSGRTAVSVSAPITGDGTTANPLNITRNNTTATSGQFITVTNGTNATFTAMTIGLDTSALKTFIAGRTTNTLTAASSAITSTVNGVAATLTPAAGTIASGSMLGFDASGNLVKGMGGADSTTASNGLTLTGKDVRLGGALTAATTITTTATNTLALAGLQSGAITDSIVVVNPTTGVLSRKSIEAFPDKTQANNGLSKSGDTVQLGGALTKATTITTTATNTIALAGLQSGRVTDSILVINPTTNVVSRISAGRFKNGNLVEITATSYTVADTIDVVIFRGTAPATITLPSAAANIGKVVRILNYAPSATNVDVTLSPAPIVQGGATDFTQNTVSSQLSLYGSNGASALGNTIEVVSNGTSWFKLGN